MAESTPLSLSSAPSDAGAPGTRERLLASAERLFGERGFKATSLREITDDAGANLAAVHYHFGGKDALYRHLFELRFRGINLERLQRLDEAERLAGDEAVPLRLILEILLRPIAARATRGLQGPDPFAKMIRRYLSDPDPLLEEIFQREFAEIRSRFGAALIRAVPALDPMVLAVRQRFVLGATIHAFAGINLVPIPHAGNRPASAVEGDFQDLLNFLAAGLRAPAVPAAEPA